MRKISHHTDDLRNLILDRAGLLSIKNSKENELTSKLKKKLLETQKNKKIILSEMDKMKKDRHINPIITLMSCLFICTFCFFAVIGQKSSNYSQKYIALEAEQNIKTLREESVKKKGLILTDISEDTFYYSGSKNRNGFLFIQSSEKFNDSYICQVKGKDFNGKLIYEPIMIPSKYMANKVHLFDYIQFAIKLD